jgi:hypothetical protein
MKRLRPYPPAGIDEPLDEDVMLHRGEALEPDPEENDPDHEIDPIDYSASYNNPLTGPTPKIVRIQTSSHAAGPTDGAINTGTEPDVTTDIYVVNPVRSPQPIQTEEIMYMLKAPASGPIAAVAVAAGFQVMVWVRDRGSRQWGQTTLFTVAYGQWVVTGDFNGGELFFQIVAASVATAGAIEIHVLEQA